MRETECKTYKYSFFPQDFKWGKKMRLRWIQAGLVNAEGDEEGVGAER